LEEKFEDSKETVNLLTYNAMTK